MFRKSDKTQKELDTKKIETTNSDKQLASYNEFMINNMNEEPLKYIESGFTNFINTLDKSKLDELLKSKKT